MFTFFKTKISIKIYLKWFKRKCLHEKWNHTTQYKVEAKMQKTRFFELLTEIWFRQNTRTFIIVCFSSTSFRSHLLDILQHPQHQKHVIVWHSKRVKNDDIPIFCGVTYFPFPWHYTLAISFLITSFLSFSFISATPNCGDVFFMSFVYVFIYIRQLTYLPSIFFLCLFVQHMYLLHTWMNFV